MAYKKVKAGSYKWPVVITPPAAEGGGFDSCAMEVEFRRVKRTQLEKVQNNLELLRLVVCGWSDYKDEAGAEIKFSDKELNELLEDSCFLQAAASAFYDSITGAKEKN